MDPGASADSTSPLSTSSSVVNMAQNAAVDLYSIPVFLLELLVLGGLSYTAYYGHFQYEHEPMITGFYCDDTSYKQQYEETTITKQFNGKEDELYVLLTLLAVPLMLIIFCELVNSMFGSLKFRQVRALCNCCKLHSITRRTVRFVGAYLLGFLLVMISCDILANTTGRLRPYFLQECPNAYQQCVSGASLNDLQPQPSQVTPTTVVPSSPPIDSISPPGRPISALSNASSPLVNEMTHSSALLRNPRDVGAVSARSLAPAAIANMLERQWISLAGKNLSQLCQFVGDHEEVRQRSQSIAMSWPSSPAALFSYACLFIACYLCFIGTARPFRIVTSVLVMVLVILVTLFDVQLVKDHYQHWDDTLAGTVLALVVVLFVLRVYLNKFKDSHYYENQQLHKKKIYVYENYRGYQNEAAGQFQLDKMEPTMTSSQMNMQNGEIVGSMSNNDLAMRYFQIPRANYRGAPRPLSSLNQMRRSDQLD